MGYKLLEQHLTPAERESAVKSYHCTSLASRLLGLKAEGYLTVTNKRVVFHAFGSSYGGESVLQSEMPVEDVSGISFYKGTYFSVFHLLTALFLAWIGSSIIGVLTIAILGAITASSIRRGTLEPTTIQIIIGILGILSGVASFSYAKDSLLRPVLSATAGTFFLILSGASFLTDALSAFGPLTGRASASSIGMSLAFLAGIVTLLNIFWYSRRPTMSLAIGSKGGATTPIQISGFRGFGFHNTAALKALTAEPAEQAESLIEELGALILDVQTIGDLGIQKWTASE